MKTPIALAVVLLLVACTAETPEPSPPVTPNQTRRAVTVKTGCFFLLRRDEQVAAVRLTESILKGDGGLRYEWHLSSDGSGNFAGPAASSGHGEVFEKYLRSPNEDGSTHLTNDGGVLYLASGPFTPEWSSRSRMRTEDGASIEITESWIYFPDDRPLEIAVTPARTLEKIDLRSPDLVWLKKSPPPVILR